MAFTENWFNYARYYDAVVERMPDGAKMLEIGVFEGRSTCHMAFKIRQCGRPIEFHACDLFEQNANYNHNMSIAVGNLNELKLDSFVTLHKGRSSDVLASFPDYSLDFVFVDGSHCYEDIVQDIGLALKKLKPGGILAGHDFGLKDVKDAINKFGLTVKLHDGDVWEVTSKIGIVHVAWGEHNINEAERSAWWGKMPTCLVTTLDQHVPNPNIFGQIIRTDFSRYNGLHIMYKKLAAFDHTPFDITMYCDTDTFPIGDLALGFNRANRFDFAAVIAPGNSFYHNFREYIHYNGGALWFKGKPVEWVKRVIEYAQVFTQNDEPSWSIAFDELGINPSTLPETFNFIVAGRIHDRSVRMWHSRIQPHHFLTHQMCEIYR